MEDGFSTATIVGLPVTRELSMGAIQWAKGRKISKATLAKMPVASVTASFPELGRKEAIAFLYPTGWKARALETKAFTQKKGTAQAFWNLTHVLKGPMEKVYIVEGEMDALALVEAGITPNSVLSCPTAVLSGENNFNYIHQALGQGLSKAKKFIWCGDQDAIGLALRSVMVKAIGVARFAYIDWPDGIKDANEYLLKYQDLRNYINAAKDWPADGLYHMEAIPEPPLMVQWGLGFAGWQSKVKIAPGCLSVVTGHPGHGKTQLFSQIFFQVCRMYDLVACVASFETRAKPHLRRTFRSLHSGLLEYQMSEEQIAAADRWIQEHYLFLIHSERRPDLRWLLDQAETAVVRHGAKILQIDPWNRLEASREPKESETEYIGRCLREFYNFAVDFNAHVQIIAHPAKIDSRFRGRPAELEDISGSKNWDNMVDQGFVVHRPALFDEDGVRDTYAELHHKKARFEELGYPTKFGLEYVIAKGCYEPRELRKKERKKQDFKPSGGDYED